MPVVKLFWRGLVEAAKVAAVLIAILVGLPLFLSSGPILVGFLGKDVQAQGGALALNPSRLEKVQRCVNPLGERAGWVIPNNVYSVKLSRPQGVRQETTSQQPDIQGALVVLAPCYHVHSVAYTVKTETRTVSGVTLPPETWNDTMTLVLERKF